MKSLKSYCRSLKRYFRLTAKRNRLIRNLIKRVLRRFIKNLLKNKYAFFFSFVILLFLYLVIILSYDDTDLCLENDEVPDFPRPGINPSTSTPDTKTNTEIITKTTLFCICMISLIIPCVLSSGKEDTDIYSILMS